MMLTPKNLPFDNASTKRYLLRCGVMVGALSAILAACPVGPHANVPNAQVKRPTLPAVAFPAQAGINRTSQPIRIASKETLLGATELVAFSSTAGLCVEVDHVPLASRAGGCSFRPPSRKSPSSVAAQGYAAGLGVSGVTEIIGNTRSTVHSIRIEYRAQAVWRSVPVLLGTAPPELRKDPDPSKWFAANLPGCLESDQIRISAYGPGRIRLGSIPGLPQRDACRQGNGYKVRGEVLYGALPASVESDVSSAHNESAPNDLSPTKANRTVNLQGLEPANP